MTGAAAHGYNGPTLPHQSSHPPWSRPPARFLTLPFLTCSPDILRDSAVEGHLTIVDPHYTNYDAKYSLTIHCFMMKMPIKLSRNKPLNTETVAKCVKVIIKHLKINEQLC